MTGAHERDRTADLVLTKDVLCQLSYVSRILSSVFRRRQTLPGIHQTIGAGNGARTRDPQLGRLVL
jgi:hypothetical protein